jgi:hypothetical protein
MYEENEEELKVTIHSCKVRECILHLANCMGSLWNFKEGIQLYAESVVYSHRVPQHHRVQYTSSDVHPVLRVWPCDCLYYVQTSLEACVLQYLCNHKYWASNE